MNTPINDAKPVVVGDGASIQVRVDETWYQFNKVMSRVEVWGLYDRVITAKAVNLDHWKEV